MSVDPDDVTPLGIKASGAEVVFYGAPVLPGSQFMLAYQGHVPICGVPGGALYSKFTTLDLLLPRIFAEERINRSDIVAWDMAVFVKIARYVTSRPVLLEKLLIFNTGGIKRLCLIVWKMLKKN